MWLDNLGLSARNLSEAYKDYGENIGVEPHDLTFEQRKAALIKHVKSLGGPACEVIVKQIKEV